MTALIEEMYALQHPLRMRVARNELPMNSRCTIQCPRGRK